MEQSKTTTTPTPSSSDNGATSDTFWAKFDDADLPNLDVRNQGDYTKEAWLALVAEWKKRSPDAEATVRKLQASFPGAKVIYMGHSLGSRSRARQAQAIRRSQPEASVEP